MPYIIGDPGFVCSDLASAEDGFIVISLWFRFLSCCIRDGTLDFFDIHKEFSKQGSAINVWY
jgi:hypothetical protein